MVNILKTIKKVPQLPVHPGRLGVPCTAPNPHGSRPQLLTRLAAPPRQPTLRQRISNPCMSWITFGAVPKTSRHSSRASGRNAMASTSAHSPAMCRARNRARTCRTAGSATAAPRSSSRRPTGHSDRSPLRRNASRSAGAGTRSRRAGRAYSDRP